ncbi:uncharacterized protein STEHIDRAFT_122746 [Stereum hirsutum FP-91666 SS1]|uniref:uncharacterized protein n=1 Tax=Stereum hirsutum (strain FP-91666) TaxID=721885 RepID=UPI0004449C38|nr:uncharacterized protein STEHIDRAFT_122746 [Stereum hirsutum FP-91666 SS1]EIM84784.1 hypothetical protein STEHIDRAFT_122746 [Stereum hirsutum FP-91666 SS1]
MNEIEAVGEALSRFNYLRLSFTCGLPFIGTVDDRNEDIDHNTVVTWGEACPTLQYCATYKSVWERIGGAWARSSP